MMAGDHELELFDALNSALEKYQEATRNRIQNISVNDFNKIRMLTVDTGGGCLRTPYSLRIVKL